MISVLNFMYVPGKSLEVVAFEVKKSWEEALEGVYESLAFTVFSHRAFLVVRNELGTEPLMDKVRNECGRNGVGLIVYSVEDDQKTAKDIDVWQDSAVFTPAANQINLFIEQQVKSAEDKKKILAWIK